MSVVPDSIRYLRVRRISGEVKYFFALPNSPTRRELPLGENRDLAIDRLYELLLVHRLQNRSESNNIAFAIQLFQEFELRHLDKLTVIENRKVIQRLLVFLKLRNFDIKDLGSTEFVLSYQLWLGFNRPICAKSDSSFLRMKKLQKYLQMASATECCQA